MESSATSEGTQALPEVWAAAEVLEGMGWNHREELKRARARGFPEPFAHVAGGKIAIWDASAVRAWALETFPQGRKRAWRRAEAVRVYRRTGVVAEAARAVGAHPDSVRGWLRAAGEQLPTERDASA